MMKVGQTAHIQSPKRSTCHQIGPLCYHPSCFPSLTQAKQNFSHSLFQLVYGIMACRLVINLELNTDVNKLFIMYKSTISKVIVSMLPHTTMLNVLAFRSRKVAQKMGVFRRTYTLQKSFIIQLIPYFHTY
jgi:hypothetical protein